MRGIGSCCRSRVVLALISLLFVFQTGCSIFSPTNSGTPKPAPTYSISGAISPAAAGVTVSLKGPVDRTTITDSHGAYSFEGLPVGTYTVTPDKSQYTFNPASHSTTVTSSAILGINFTAVEHGNFILSGTIFGGGGATVTLSGEAQKTTTADAAGNFMFTGLESGAYIVTPTKSQFAFTPSERSETLGTSNVTGVDFTAKLSGGTTYSISGVVSPSAYAAGVTVSLSGSASAMTTTNSAGQYTFSNLSSGAYTIVPSKTDFTFSPAGRTATVGTANVSGENFTAAQIVTGGGVTIYPGQDIAGIVSSSPAGTTFVITPGKYRLTRAIIPKNGDSFLGQTVCAPPATSCPAIISGSVEIGPQAVFDGTNYRVVNQTQHGPVGVTAFCDPGWERCIYPEDLFFDGVPYKHLASTTKPAIGPKEWWFDYTNHVIYFHDNPSGHMVETSVVGTAFGGPANNVTIQYLTLEQFADMYPNGTVSMSQGPNAFSQGTNWTVQNSESRLNHGYGIRVAFGIHVLNNYIHDNGQMGVGGGIGVTSNPATESANSGIVIQDNLIVRNDYAHFDPNFGSGGIKIGATSGVTIRGNKILNNEGAAIHFDDYSQSELVDGNTLADNYDSDGLVQEKGYGTSTFRNNIVQRNGGQVYEVHFTSQIATHDSAGVNAYCNVLEIAPGKGMSGWIVGASNRGTTVFPPFQYLTSVANSFHHNTVIWDAGAAGGVGFLLYDAAHQPNFFADNKAPDYNTYHLANSSAPRFVYDHNDSQINQASSFTRYQTSGADVHGTVDANITSGFPTVRITSPADQSASTTAVPVSAAASDPSGISKVDFYLDWVLKASVASAPYTANLAAGSPGPHTVAAMAYSNAGIRSCYAVTVNVE